MKEKNSNSILTIIIGLFFWMLYICDYEMARYGIYTIFSYRVHEILTIIPFLSFIITIGWFISIIIKFVRKKYNKSNVYLCIVLLVLLTSQYIYIHNQSKLKIMYAIASIESIDREKLEIIVEIVEKKITLDSPMLVQDILKTDGTEYGITYEWNKSNPDYGKLCMIHSIK